MQQYFLAISLGEKISKAIEEISKKYCGSAGKQPFPHLTIYPPFFVETSEEDIVEALQSALVGIAKKTLTLNSIGFFERKNVVYLCPNSDSKKWLGDLASLSATALQGKMKDVRGKHALYVPHIALAKRIPEEEFQKIRSQIARLDPNLSFNTSSVTLYKWNDASKRWQTATNITLADPLA
ncbi:MAG: hypothetical protein AUK31_09405 [Fibrobacteres bacterium CG2_30_45_31]|nr:MAG: hypothetical protein AUK31_09405 [Fibrobacteres bacterium CG2_30_45_31]